MQVKIDVCDSDVMSRDEVMDKIANSQGWDVVLRPDSGNGEDYRIVTNDGKNRQGTYSVANDEIEWDDGAIGSLFYDYEGNEDYTGGSMVEFFGVATAIWGTTGETEYDEKLVLYTE